MKRVQEICAKHGVLIIADEVMCGAHRAGGASANFFASAEFGLKPDILTLGKGIGAGYFPLSAVLTRQEHVDAMKGGSGGFAHAQTFMMHPLASVVGVAVLSAMEKERVGDNVRTLSPRLISGVQKNLTDHPHVGSVQGSGFMLGIEFVSDRATKRPFDRKHKVAETLLAHALESGVTLWPNVGHADGISGDLVMVGPPLNSTAAEVDEVVSRVCDVVRSFKFPS
jgi:adenosylmethionine-8-amino-7-oxononanoate aminotransferase